ncbi:MAG: glycoside hydrolase family 28 protein [Bacteroidota bacterium]
MIKRFPKSFLLFAIIVAATSYANAQQYYNVLKYGAKNDSSKIATKAIANAIAAAVKAGGGTVYFPAGKYLTGPIHLKSNITIFIDAGAELHFSDNFDHYLPMVESRYEGVDVTSFSPLFYAYKAENISIIGRGIIDGHGKKWWHFVEGYKADQPRSKWQYMFDSLNKNILLPDEPGQMKRGFLRPPFIQPMYCKNVLVEGITIRNSPFWTVNPEFCENVTVAGVTINNPPSPNTDGINPESCKYVHISNCHISVGDDCITIKSGKDIPGRTRNSGAENYTITNCTMLSGHGGVVIGSEMSGGVKKIVISNCIFDGTDRGIRIKTTRGRGASVEEIRVDNIVMKNIRMQAIVLDMQYSKAAAEPVSERTPQFKNIRFSNITAQTKEAVYINGLEEMPVEGISFNDIQFAAETGMVIKKAKNIELHNVTVTTTKGPAVDAENVDGLELDGVKTMKPITGIPAVILTDVQNVFLHSCWPVVGTETFLQLKGKQTKGIVVKNNNFINAAKPLVKTDDVLDMVNVD